MEKFILNKRSFSWRKLKISYKKVFPGQTYKFHSKIFFPIKNERDIHFRMSPSIPPLINLIYEIIFNNQFRSHQEWHADGQYLLQALLHALPMSQSDSRLLVLGYEESHGYEGPHKSQRQHQTYTNENSQ